MKRITLALVTLFTTLSAGSLPTSTPEEAGLSTERLKRVHALVQRYIDKGEIAGAVSLVARRGRIAHFEAQGWMDLETRKPVRNDTIFRLASMTKPVTSLAVMMLHEEGHFLLDDPVSKFLPEFKDAKVAIANAPNERHEAGYRLVPAERPITIRQLLTHSAGLASGSGGPTMGLMKALSAGRKPEDLLADHIRRLAGLPLNFQPGAAWEYGPATDVLGRLVEVISGQPLDQFFRRRILAPLEMNDTWFYLPDDRLPRLVSAYAKKDGALEKLTAPGPASRTGRYFGGGGGLAGTAGDYYRLCQMFLNGGQFNGVRLVSRKTVEAMTVNQIGRLPLWQDSYKSYGFGLGFRVREQVGQSATLGSAGEYGWGGAYGTYFWVDPKEQMIGILMIQLMPYAHINLRPEFQNAVTQAIVD
ncbi:MAG TPA: serine hydrolase domain-containing protein [Bryobacteraceae bacterium]|jgi:CubicO group peptidase (beta-lactamase class C family)|nr:serine hydrolase domain-containing protein [Bryobacteraceae bacterium]